MIHLLVVALALLTFLLGKTSGIDVAEPNFLTKEELDVFLALSTEADALQKLYGGPNYMEVILDSLLLCRIKKLIARNANKGSNEEESFCENTQNPGVVGLQSTTGTVSLHTDFDDKDEHVEDEVVLIFLNTNPHAFFVHGNKEETVEAGKLLVFKGNVLHQLRKDVGIVRMLGPFQMSTFCLVRHSKMSELSDRDLFGVGCGCGSCGAPSNVPSGFPSYEPSDIPSNPPSDEPSDIPSNPPSYEPSDIPSNLPSKVPSPEVVIEGIINDINNDNIAIGNALTTKLNEALEMLKDSSESGAIQILEAFLNQVMAQRGKKIPVKEADEWIAEIKEVIAELEGGPLALGCST